MNSSGRTSRCFRLSIIQCSYSIPITILNCVLIELKWMRKCYQISDISISSLANFVGKKSLLFQIAAFVHAFLNQFVVSWLLLFGHIQILCINQFNVRNSWLIKVLVLQIFLLFNIILNSQNLTVKILIFVFESLQFFLLIIDIALDIIHVFVFEFLLLEDAILHFLLYVVIGINGRLLFQNLLKI